VKAKSKGTAKFTHSISRGTFHSTPSRLFYLKLHTVHRPLILWAAVEGDGGKVCDQVCAGRIASTSGLDVHSKEERIKGSEKFINVLTGLKEQFPKLLDQGPPSTPSDRT
jgi:hypothetical protein